MKIKDLKWLRFYLDWTQTPYKEFAFSGSPRGTTEGFPYADGEYETVRHGTLKMFYTPSSQEVKDEEGVWIRVFNFNTHGSADEPGRHISVWVRKEDKEKITAVEESEWKRKCLQNLRERVKQLYKILYRFHYYYTPAVEEEVAGIKPPPEIWRHMEGLWNALSKKGADVCSSKWW